MSKKKSIKDELGQLQLNSWNLELIISGLALFILTGIESIIDQKAEFTTYFFDRGPQSAMITIMMVANIFLKSVWYCTLINLIVHLFLRGFWIALIGLRYVSGDIQLLKLKFHKRYTDDLGKMSPYDDFIEKIENICSVIFSFTFLLFFFALSFIAFFVFLFISDYVIDLLFAGKKAGLTIGFAYVLILPWVFYFIDSVTLGGIKRLKNPGFIHRIYFPIYKVLNILSLSFLYRHILYNLIDNRYGKRVLLLLFSYLIVLFFGAKFRIDAHDFAPSHELYTSMLKRGELISNDLYDDVRNEDRYIRDVSVPSLYLETDVLPIFFSYNPEHDLTLKKLCPDVHFSKTKSITLKNLMFNSDEKSPIDFAQFSSCFQESIAIRIGDAKYDSLRFFFHRKTPNDQVGLLTHINVEDVSEKEFLLEIDMIYYGFRHPDSLQTRSMTIPIIKMN